MPSVRRPRAKSTQVAAKKKSPVRITRPRAALPTVPPANVKLLVCTADPFQNGTWILFSETEIPADDGHLAHRWRLRAALDLPAPRFLEGWASRSSFHLQLQGLAQVGPAQAAHWADSIRTETPIAPALGLTIQADDKGRIVFTPNTGYLAARDRALTYSADRRILALDIAFQPEGATLLASATAVLSELTHAELIIDTDAAEEGLGFDKAWHRRLRKPTTNPPRRDGFVSVSGRWEFAVMNEAEYRSWCAATQRSPLIV